MRMPVIVPFLFSALVVTLQLHAQTNTCLGQTVPVTVLTEKGDLVPGLTADNFKAFIHHASVKILSLTPDRSPRRVVIVLDASRGMTSEKSEWDFYLLTAKELIKEMPSGTQLGLVVFSAQAEKAVALTTDWESVLVQLKTIKENYRTLIKDERSQKTALWDSLNESLSLFGPLQDGDTLYVISDGEDTASQLKPKEFERYMGRLRVFALMPVEHLHDSSIPEFRQPKDLIELVRKTGGTTLSVPRPRQMPGIGIHEEGNEEQLLTAREALAAKQLPQDLAAQFREIFFYYRMDLELTDAVHSGGEWSLKVVGLNARNLKVVYPLKLPACAKPNVTHE